MPSATPPVDGPAMELPSFAPASPDPKPDATKGAPKPAQPVVEPLPAPGAGPAAPLDPFPTNDSLPTPALEPAARPGSPEPRPRTDPLPEPVPAEPKIEPKVTAPPPTVRPEAPAPAPAIAPEPTPAAKLPAFTKPPIESEPAPSPADAAAALPSGGRLVRSLGKRRMTDPEPQARLAPERSVPDAPLPREEVGSRDREDPILHVVDSGENFWTISRTYYGSGRYYEALHAANRRQVPKIDELYVGTTIKVPPVGALDPALIRPPSRSTDDSATRASRSATAATPRSRSADDGRSVPSRTRGEVARGLSSSRTRDVDEPTRPTYRVRAHDTLRSIARDTLGDPHRYREILDLNRDAVDDGGRLVTGVTLTLPEDAAVRDR
jgi:nucleoid-associated protein YgaU